MAIVRIAQVVVVLLIGSALFQNCAVDNQGGPLSLGSNGPQGNSGSTSAWGTSGSTTGTTPAPNPSPAPTPSPTPTNCTCPSASTVACDQPVIDSCGANCGTGTQGCLVRCADVDSRCGPSGGQFRHNGGGGGCGGGLACNLQGQLAGDCNDCPCAPCRN